MDEATARSLVAGQAEALVALSRRLSQHGVGDRWQGPGRRACEALMVTLEDDLRTEARLLSHIAHYGGVAEVRAHFG